MASRKIASVGSSKPAAKKSTASKSKSISPVPNITLTKNENLSIRPIENGFIVSESGYTGKGRNQQYFNKEYFSKTNPIKFSK